MEYVIIGICIAAVIAVGVVLYLKNIQTKDEPENTAVVVSKSSGGELQQSDVAHKMDKSELYAEDVQLISKDGKVYYLPVSKAE